MKWKSHHLLDFGDSFGSDNDIAGNPRHGQEFWLTSRNKLTRSDAGTLSGFLGEGQVSARPAGSRKLHSGRLRPLTWKPNYPNPAFSK